jgi:hypothetical protein
MESLQRFLATLRDDDPMAFPAQELFESVAGQFIVVNNMNE